MPCSRSRSACSRACCCGAPWPPLTTTLVVFASTRLIVLWFVRPNFMAPLHQTVLPTATGVRADDWVTSDTLVDAGGETGERSRRGPQRPAHAQRASTPITYLVPRFNWKRIISYQPSDPSRTFQAFEADLFLQLCRP